MASRTFCAREIDAVLHRERLDGGKKRLHPLPMPLATTARWRDGAGGERELSDRAGPGVAVVAGRLSRRPDARARERDAADAALDVARAIGGISAGAASERAR